MSGIAEGRVPDDPRTVPPTAEDGTAHPALLCPAHHCPLLASSAGLACEQRGEIYVRINDIPRFVPASSYADAFGLQWKTYRTTQLDSYSGTTITRDRTRRCLGEFLWANLEGKRVLESGCGAGRFTEILLERGAYVTSIDLSAAVEANAENCPPSPRHQVAQADIERLPFAPGQFDVVFCLGVIQHTPDPARTIASLASQVRPGGWLVIDHNTHNLSWSTKTAPLFRAVLKRVRPETGLRWTRRLVSWLLPAHRAVRRMPAAQALLSRISPVLTYYRVFPDLNDDLQREWALLDTHDTLTAWYRHHLGRRALRRILERTGLTAIWCEKGGNGLEARAQRPFAPSAAALHPDS